MSFNLGSLLGGVGNGLKRGLELDAAFFKSLVWCVEGGHTDALNDLLAVAKQNIVEIEGTTTDVLPSVVGALVTGGDPFAGSRHLFQAWQTKYGVH